MSKTSLWLRQVIIGLKLCPFVSPGFNEPEIVVMNESSAKDILVSLDALAQKTNIEEGTYHGVHLYANDRSSFGEFYSLSQRVQKRLMKFKIPVDVICFHPEFVFDGLVYDDRGNYVNRSPFPMLHLVGRSLMGQALEGREVDFGEKISLANNQKLQGMKEDEFNKKVLKYLFAKEGD